jgi:redox-sensitive bicupin YhaK (pirin superfamily)
VGELMPSAVDGPAHALVLSGPALDEPVIAEGPFIMNDAAGSRAATRRFQARKMGQLDPV